jgi:antitoxin (DNA-binding transcriptional repressor) of toxin-antitoxin stability system
MKSTTLKNMRRASVRDLHIRTSEFVRDASGGDVIIIERRGEPVAELRPISVHLTTARELAEREVWTNDRHMLKACPHFGLSGRSV